MKFVEMKGAGACYSGLTDLNQIIIALRRVAVANKTFLLPQSMHQDWRTKHDHEASC